MIHIRAAEPTHAEWVRWRARCRSGHQHLRATYATWRADVEPAKPKPEPRGDLYGAQRDWIAAAFFFKCAYCEAKLDPGNRRGQLDHYRPKSSVRTGAGKVVLLPWGCVEEPRPHPGYYWLAYEWTNLLPVCAACNNRTSSFQGRKGGKSDFFPTVGDCYAAEPDAEAVERPLLLNPWADEPSEHMRFCPANGMIAPISEMGRETVRLLDLNRDGLVDERRELCETAVMIYRQYAENLIKAKIDSSQVVRQASRHEALRLNGLFEQWRTGNAAYSAFLVAALEYAENAVRSAFDFGGRPQGTPRGEAAA